MSNRLEVKIGWKGFVTLYSWIVQEMEMSRTEVLEFCLKLTFHNTKTFKQVPVGSCGGIMVSALVSGWSGPGSNPGWRHCVVFLGKTLNSHSASRALHVREQTSSPSSLCHFFCNLCCEITHMYTTCLALSIWLLLLSFIRQHQY